ncbi:hypothetical protein ADK52_33240 [Streptomyces sp. WM6372]|uniref:hypothetical protein n=1 Tax=Streptomyces sp. WM6372 TaxID=1415555 RepID=UPI0006AE8590|nr:hypothetical protein [Streptomyces sp. WM6372]KOU16650.1 hypothetical protein ADK52_33240 [Streptomyces sp. WM6372]
MRGAAVEILVWWAVLMGVTVVLISSLGPVELLVAGVAAAGAAVVVRFMRRAADVRVRGTAGAPRAVAGLPLAAVRGLAALSGFATGRGPGRGTGRGHRPAAGRIRRIPLRDGADPGWAGVVLGWSADTCVTDLPEGRAEAVVHSFAAAPGGGPERAVARRDGAR